MAASTPDDPDVSGPDLASLGLEGLDPDALIRSSPFCALTHAAQQLSREAVPALAQIGLSPTQYLVLGQVLSAPGSTPADLARACSLLPQTLSSILTSAEERGLVRRIGERGRGRPTRVVLTDDGVRALLAGWPVVHAAGTDRLTPGQQHLLLGLLDQLRGASHVTDDVVVLVDDAGRDAGTHARSTVHTDRTTLHRAFSTYLRRADGRVLMTRRALAKKTWPGVWTNAACGHLLPGETAEQAAERRVPQELGVRPDSLRVVLPDFRYRATDASGIVENELCPVLVGEIDADAVVPDPAEVADVAWVDWDAVRTAAERAPFTLSPWCVEQIAQLGEDPWS